MKGICVCMYESIRVVFYEMLRGSKYVIMLRRQHLDHHNKQQATSFLANHRFKSSDSKNLFSPFTVNYFTDGIFYKAVPYVLRGRERGCKFFHRQPRKIIIFLPYGERGRGLKHKFTTSHFESVSNAVIDNIPIQSNLFLLHNAE